jgi:CDP-diacylglycerol--glycerol-3-phosphate 3-phosphatidyltransferase
MNLSILPNILSFIRIPLALLFLQQNLLLRSLALLVAMVSDGLDGYIARRTRSSSTFGTLLDPFADKFFVCFVLVVFIGENRLSWWEAAAFVCRDFSVFFYGVYLAMSGKLLNYRFRAIWCGKVTTFLQFTVLMLLTLQMSVSPFFFMSFIVLGLFALVELYIRPAEMEKIR